MEIKKNRHSIFSLNYHLVVSTKYRHKCITKELLEELKNIAKNIFENSWGCDIIEMDWEEDHIHVLFSAPPQVQLSKLVNSFKTVSSRLIRKKYSDYLSKYFWKPYFWGASYGIFSTWWAPLEVIKEYVQNQNTPSSTSNGKNSPSPKL
jgi:putative transposase